MSSDTQPSPKSVTLAQNDVTEFALTRGILVIVGGEITVGFLDGTTDTYSNLQPGNYPLRIIRLLDTDTDAAAEVHGYY